MAEDLVVQRREGLYCPQGDFYIDPWRPVERAVITHAHADHSRRGHGRYLAAAPAEGVLRTRLGEEIALQTLPYGEAIEHHGVRLSFHPAGHVLGSAQVRLEHGGQVWVASGDYYVAGDRADPREDNATCTPFEPVRCHCFITESTFGLPIYRWQPQAELFADDRRLVAAQRRSRPRQPDPRLQLRQGAAHPARRRPLDRADLRARRGRAAEPRLPRRRRRPARDAAGHRGQGQGLVPPRPDRRSAVGAGLGVDAALRRAQRCLRQRLDAAARRAPPALCRPRLRPQRPRRLARAQARHRRHAAPSG